MTPNLTPLADATLAVGLSRERLLRRVQNGVLRGERIDGHWYVRTEDLANIRPASTPVDLPPAA